MEENLSNNSSSISNYTQNREETERKGKKRGPYHRFSEDMWMVYMEEMFVDGPDKVIKKHGLPKFTAYQRFKDYQNMLQTVQWRLENGETLSKLREEEEEKKKKQHAGRNAKVTPEVMEFLEEEIKKDNSLSGKRLATRVAESFKDKEDKPLQISSTTINKHLLHQGYTYKVAKTEDVATNSSTIIDDRYQHAKLMLEKNIDAAHIIYYDIKYFATNITANRARSKRGTPAVIAKGHRGVYINKHASVKYQNRKRKRDESESRRSNRARTNNINFNNNNNNHINSSPEER